jgi:NAD(P)-dependent dehydrogenase (short-subunit alcohol dehydrogenase family)
MADQGWHPLDAVVIGAGAGIGRAVALEFASRDLSVTALCRRPVALAAGSSADARIHVLQCDVSEPAQLRHSLEHAGPAPIVVHTAAAGAPIGPIWECDEAEAAAALATMVASVWQTARICLERMVAAGSGVVLLASSGAASKIAPARATYSMCKAAVDQLVRVVGAELELVDAEVGIAAFYPGMVDTAMQQDARAGAERLQDTAFGADLTSFQQVAASGSLLRPDAVAVSIADLAMRSPRELNGKIWRLRDETWSAA